jgi:SPX domain protein involved in polyphosphate accumulation
MVKFEEQVERQLVREWKHGYFNYKLLKQDLKKLREILEKDQHRGDQVCFKYTHYDRNTDQDHIHSSYASPVEDFRQIKHQQWSLFSQSGIEMVC